MRMNSIGIREFDEFDFQFYTECLSDEKWRNSYGDRENYNNLDELVLERLKDYPFVKRYIIFNKNNKKLAFIVSDFKEKDSDQCIMAGGVSPKLVGQGYGVKSTIIFCCHIFANFPKINNIVAYHQNEFSERMLLKIGFIIADSSNAENPGNNKLVIDKKKFPNSFCRRLINRLDYVEK